MKRTALALMCLLTVVTVIIDVRYEGIAPCPQPPRTVTKNADGTYSEYRSNNSMNLTVCMESYTWREEWTDYPERGGVFIRRAPPSGEMEAVRP